MQFTSFLDDGHLTVALTGEIDHTCAKGYISAIAAKIEAYTPEECVLDFSEVTFVDSSGIAVLLRIYRRVREIDGRVTVRGTPEQAMKVLKAAGLQKLMKFA